MTINQTLDKIEEHIAGILPAFIMLGVVVFIIFGLGACVAPVSAVILDDVDFEVPSGYMISSTETVNVLVGQIFGPFYYYGEPIFPTYLRPTTAIESGALRIVLSSTSGSVDSMFISSLARELSFTNPSYCVAYSVSGSLLYLTFVSVDAYGLSSEHPYYDGLRVGDDSLFTYYPIPLEEGGFISNILGPYYLDSGMQYVTSDYCYYGTDHLSFGGDAAHLFLYGTDYTGSTDSLDEIDGYFYNNEITTTYHYQEYVVPNMYVIKGGSVLDISSPEEATVLNLSLGGLASGMAMEVYFDYSFYSSSSDCFPAYLSVIESMKDYVLDVSSNYPGAYFTLYTQMYDYTSGGYNPSNFYVAMYHPGSVSETPDEPEPEEPSGEDHQFDVNYDSDTDTYDVSLIRNGEPWYLSIKGKAFGWLPIYTYTTVQDESIDLSLSGLPSRFFGFDLSYHAEVYRLGSGLESSNYSYYTYDWTRGDFIDKDGNILNPDIIGEEGEKVDFDPLVKPPFLEDGGYDTPGIEDIDHDGVSNDEDDDMDGDGIPNDEDPELYNPYNNGILGSLGVTQGIQFPSFESLEQMIRNMRLPESLKDMFQLMTPEEYKAALRVDETHVLYGYQNGWFSTADGTVGLVLGIVLVLAALIAVIPRTIFEFFSSLIVWLSTAFQSFYDWLVIPSEIFNLVIDLLPEELLSLALLLFGIDLVFLFFRFVIPGMISGSRALGDIVEKEEKMRLVEEFGEETYNKLYGKKRGGGGN